MTKLTPQGTILMVMLAGWRIHKDESTTWRNDYWNLFTPSGAWVGKLFNSEYAAALEAVDQMKVVANRGQDKADQAPGDDTLQQ